MSLDCTKYKCASRKEDCEATLDGTTTVDSSEATLDGTTTVDSSEATVDGTTTVGSSEVTLDGTTTVDSRECASRKEDCEATVEDSGDSCDSEIFPFPDLSVYAKQGNVSTGSECTTGGPVKSSEKPKMYVKWSSNVRGKRVFDKKHVCLFCEKSSTNLTKHLLNAHTDESLVKDVLQLPKKSQERKHHLEKIGNMGDFKHNCAVRSKGESEIILWRSPPEPVPASDYVTCPDCFAFFQRSHLWRHHRDCAFCSHAGWKHPFKCIPVEAELLLPTTEHMSAALKTIMGSMRKDQYSLIIKNDPTIIKYGEKLTQKYGHLKHLHHHVSCKTKELARFLTSIRRLDSATTWLSDCMFPSKFDVVVQAVRHLCGYNDESYLYQIPSLALKIGHSLKKCCAILSCDSIKRGDEERRKFAVDFMYLCEKEWTSEVSSAAVSTLVTTKMNKPQLMPLTEDIQKLNSYISAEIDRCTEALKSDLDVSDNWQKLSKATLAGIIVFSRKRSGEAERMLISEYSQKDVNPLANKDVLESLTEVEKILCQRMSRVEIRGKRGRTVPVILSHDLLTLLNSLI